MVALFGVLLVAACPPPAPTPSYYGGQQQPGGSQAQAGSQQAPPEQNGLSCMQLFGCFQQCTDGPCIQDCLGQANPGAADAAQAAMGCSSQRCAGQGGDCLGQQCAAEVQACQGTPYVAAAPQQPAYADPGQPAQEQMVPGQPHTTANLLPWMTGAWIGTNHQFTFWADGHVRRARGNAMYTDQGNYSCLSRTNEDGTVTQQGDLLIMVFGAADQNHCGDKDSRPGVTVRYRITWPQAYGGEIVLQLDDIDCTAGPMWCNDRMTRRQ